MSKYHATPRTTNDDASPSSRTRSLLRPLVTEKGMHRSTRNNAYAFEVHRLATKADVRAGRAKSCSNVKVLKVHTQNRKGKPRRTRFRSGTTGTWKKAIVTLGPRTPD